MTDCNAGFIDFLIPNIIYEFLSAGLNFTNHNDRHMLFLNVWLTAFDDQRIGSSCNLLLLFNIFNLQTDYLKN